MSKYRSRTNYATVYGGDKKGYNLGVDGAIYLKREGSPRTFQAPAIGTQGKSVSAVSASTDISASPTPATLKATVHGGTQVTASFATTGLTTGTLIAAALETAINAALLASGQDTRVWVSFDAGGPDQYTVYDQYTGLSSAVIIANGTSNNIADDLNLGLANAGTETVGTDDADFLLYTTGGPTFDQPVESNQHRSGRFHTGIVKKKKVAEFDFDTYVNMSGSADASIDNAVALLMEAALGKKTVVSGVATDFEQDLPTIYMSMVRVSTIFGEYYTGAYVKTMTLDFPGDGPATVKYAGKASNCFTAGIAKVLSAVVAAQTIPVVTDDEQVFTNHAPVMLIDTDGRTILAGVDGSLVLDQDPDTGAHSLHVGTSVSVPMNGFVVPWDPGAVQQTGRDAIFTDLAGSFKFNGTGSAIDVTHVSLEIANDHVDLDNRFGADANKGYVAGNRMTAKLSVTFDLSNENFGKVVQARNFPGFAPEIVLGSTSSGRFLKVTAPKWITAVPKIEVPQNGTTPITMEGTLYQSSAGAKDPVKLRFG